MPASIEVKPFSEIAELDSFADWCREYIEETANPVIPDASPQIANWKACEAEGKLRCIAVMDEGVLAGMIVLLVSRSNHYPFPVIGMDSFYLRKPWRKGRLGLDLFGAAKAVVKREGAPGFCLMAPPGSVLEKLCERWGFTNTHKAYWCQL